jgi:hypothetical protein
VVPDWRVIPGDRAGLEAAARTALFQFVVSGEVAARERLLALDARLAHRATLGVVTETPPGPGRDPR